MQVIIVDTPEEAGRVAAEEVAKVIRRVGPGVVLGVATGSSPLTTYEALVDIVRSEQLDLSQASAFALDEYVNFPVDHEQSYTETIRRTVTEPLALDPARVHLPDGLADDLAAAGAAYEQAIREAGGIDVQIMGTGSNGHIGFNEPGSSFASRTRPVKLAAQTREDNARFFDSIDEVPEQAMSQGLGTILDTRTVVLIATGEGKADAVAGIVEGPVTAMVPGSILQFHPDATLVIDAEAASKLQHLELTRDLRK
ncbi:glucosamine-6-phosphate deaminase [Gulosibacter macacae]|uniref:Glucosamine-6-phosphate deaminase n=1 Tax=Gulosibacter macacae TaxID=2488791 RepID=A0A3P3VVB2_9MICO|nr:glucosamine-6-phosphate deaminase [Gulosibacter macacae]RRJ86741.1 glucosamine-6-phosphate deaminase [Gulosibacter macacae]